MNPWHCSRCDHVGWPLISDEIDECPYCSGRMYPPGEVPVTEVFETAFLGALLIGGIALFLYACSEGLTSW